MELAFPTIFTITGMIHIYMLAQYYFKVGGVDNLQASL
jgi:hypothetical protein